MDHKPSGPKLFWTIDQRVYWTLRIATAMCFIGHGAFGIITKKVWLNYFAVFGIGPELGWKMMPLVGTFDVALGLSLLLYPTRAVWSWLVFWGTTTALLRPLSGEPIAEAIERAGNYGMPLVMLILCGPGRRASEWFTRVGSDIQVDAKIVSRAVLAMRVFGFMLLAGHGWLNLIGKPGLLTQYSSLGFADTTQVAHAVGAFEVVAAVSVLFLRIRPVLLVLFAWKMGSELFYPHWEVFEWIERGGSYGALLGLWFLLPKTFVRDAVVSQDLSAVSA